MNIMPSTNLTVADLLMLFTIVQLPQNKRAVVAVLGGHFAIEEIFCECVSLVN